MKFSTLHYFLVVAQELNITKAAEKLYITQQSLSEQISRLEAEYQVKLFERTPRLHLTEAGERMVVYAEKILKLETQYRNEMKTCADGDHLSVGIRNPYSNLILPEILPEFVRTHPNVRLHITVSSSRTLLQMLLTNQLDFCLGSPRLLVGPEFDTIYLPPDEFSIIIPENILQEYFGLTGKDIATGKLPDYGMLADAPLLMMKEPNCLTRRAVDHFMETHDILSHNVLMECFSIDTELMAASLGLGVTFVQNHVFQNYIERNIMKEKLFGFPMGVSSVDLRSVLSYRHDAVLSSAAVDFMQQVQTLFTSLS